MKHVQQKYHFVQDDVVGKGEAVVWYVSTKDMVWADILTKPLTNEPHWEQVKVPFCSLLFRVLIMRLLHALELHMLHFISPQIYVHHHKPLHCSHHCHHFYYPITKASWTLGQLLWWYNPFDMDFPAPGILLHS
ncbi:hypothetical protein L210DRAFT_3394822 [Boletus edulis BED1]|uniref:Uncharacterized protein n=1 Tax=Boletus edulis BED1 TaxID=1328754 RepID=A0AAD4BZW5_BOLED|nr:hypothetical protein L210DRAFT_3394822 [Boletus edulis BED1]